MKNGNKFISDCGTMFLCKLCGNVYDINEYNEGYCKKCSDKIEDEFIREKNKHLKDLRNFK